MGCLLRGYQTAYNEFLTITQAIAEDETSLRLSFLLMGIILAYRSLFPRVSKASFSPGGWYPGHCLQVA